MQPYDQQQQAPKKGMGALGVVLIIFGILGAMGLATCAAGYFWVKGKVAKVAAELGDGGGALVLVSPAAVKEALAGPKKDYVGTWASKQGSTLTIEETGNMDFEKDEDGDGVKEKLNAPIARFSGNDIQCQAIITLTIHVTEAPHMVSGHWQMNADGIELTR
jgi:hypothetical protein